jgi:transketolase C-terminal domain/subunit
MSGDMRSSYCGLILIQFGLGLRPAAHGFLLFVFRRGEELAVSLVLEQLNRLNLKFVCYHTGLSFIKHFRRV